MKNVLSSIHSLWVQCENAQSVYVNLLRFSYVGGNYALKGCAIYHFFFLLLRLLVYFDPEWNIYYFASDIHCIQKMLFHWADTTDSW